MEQFDSRYFRGQGPLFIAQRDAAGVPTGFVFVGDLGEASLTPNVDRVEIRENVSGISAVANSFIRGVQYDLTLRMRSIRRDHLAQALQGAATAKTAASVTDEAHTGYHDKFIALDHNKVSAVVVTDSTGVTTYTAGTDYVLQADEGLVEILSTGTITDGQALLIDYSYAAQSHVQVAPTNQEFYLMFAGINTADNDKQTRCELYKVTLDPSVLSLITDEHAEMPLSGRVLLDTLRPSGDQLYSWKIED